MSVRWLFALFAVPVLIVAPQALGAPESGGTATRYELKTDAGSCIIELDAKAYPDSAAEFRRRCAFGMYEGAVFARRPGAELIQLGSLVGGGPAPECLFTPEPGAQLTAGSLAWALERDGGNAGYAFFICLKELPQLGTRYTPFARVVDGRDVAAALLPGDAILSLLPEVREARYLPLGGRH